jgi:ABC-2 type transport system permease protein
MKSLKSWRALLVREYFEHRVAFLYFPLGIVILLALSAVASLGADKLKLVVAATSPDALKIYEFGYLVLLMLWVAYLALTLFFYFGDAFNADRRNNAMFFWKSMPVSDLKILTSKMLAGSALFPTIIFLIAACTGLLLFAFVSIGAFVSPGMIPRGPFELLGSWGQITLFGAAYFVLAMLWYAPFLAWVGGLSTVFGRWSLPLAFVIPGLFAVVENIVLFGQGPRGGYVWGFLSHRWSFGLGDNDFVDVAVSPAAFDAATYVGRLTARIDWLSLGLGLVVAALFIWLASEYRRRRLP